MERYFKKRTLEESDANDQQRSKHVEVSSSFSLNVDDNEGPTLLDGLQSDPGLRKNIYDYDANDREGIRRAYLQKGPCQSRKHDFPWRQLGKRKRRFIPLWFNDHKNWLEYSIAKDAAFCLCCYLFKPEHGEQGGGDSFVGEGFRNWKSKDRLTVHVGGLNSIHNQCVMACEDLMKPTQHIEVCFSNQSDQARIDYRNRLTASITCIRFLLGQGLAFRGHDETEDSLNQGNFLELLHLLADNNEVYKNVVLNNAPENLKMTSNKIQKDIVNAIAVETTNAILEDMGDDLFSIMVDESRDMSVKEQMAVVLRYVDKKGCIIERFLAVVHVGDTTTLSLKAAIDSLFSKHKLSISSLRGQGYDGASNMQGEFNGLKALIMMENKCAFYVYCFAHQLQLTLVAVAKKHLMIGSFFNLVTRLSNVVGVSCKRREILRCKQFERVQQGILHGDITTGQGLNQEATLKRPGDTRWGSHYGTLLSVIGLFSSVVDVLEVIKEDGTISEHKSEANDLADAIQCFGFAFQLHLMRVVLGITNDLSRELQKQNQDIINAMTLVQVSKQRLQTLRDDGWESLLDAVCVFCQKHGIIIPRMDDLFVSHGRSRRNAAQVTILHHYRVELFYTVVDMQLQELNNRFNEVNTELLLCMASLDPSNSFSKFDMTKLLRFAEFYSSDFSSLGLLALADQLENYIVDVRSSSHFSEVKGIGGLAQKMIETKKDSSYPEVYLHIKLALLLPVATATVERVFSAMKIIKTSLRNRMCDEWMNDCLVTFIEKDIFKAIDNEAILQRFQNMKQRRGVL